MSPSRTCRYVPLSHKPLVLVLGQVRFSRVQSMPDYLPGIQDVLRRQGYPLDQSGKVQHITFTPVGVQTVEIERGDYRSRDEQWSVTVLQDAIALQTTDYGRFEDFAERLTQALTTVLEATELSAYGVVERVGLRYINAITPRDGQDHRDYLRPGFHGIGDGVFAEGTHRLFVESIGQTMVGEDKGTMVVRIAQNDQGLVLPPDLIGSAPKLPAPPEAGGPVTLVDMDHFIEGKFDPDPEWVIARAYAMHDQLIEAFHDHVVTEHAIEVWR